MKKNIIILIVFIFTLTSCSPKEENVDVFIYNKDDPYMFDFSEQILNKSNDSYSVYYSQNSQVIQNQSITTSIENDTDIMIINPVDRLSVYVIIEKLKQEEIPVIFFNREPLKRDLDLYSDAYYIGAPAEQPGIFQAEMIIELFGNDSNDLNELDLNNDNTIQVVILKGEQGHQDAEARTKSVIEEFQSQGFAVEVLSINVASWNQTTAESEMTEIIEEFTNQFEVVISNNDAMAIGAIKALIDHQYFIDDNLDGKLDKNDTSWIPVIGVDGLNEAKDYIESGHMYGTVINDTEAMVDAMINLTDSLLNEKDLQDLTYPLVDENYIWINYKKYTNN